MDIRNGGVQKGDVHGGAVGSHEVVDESLGLVDLRPGAADSLRGAQGPRGPQGPRGLQGPKGDSGDDAPLLDTLSHLLYVEDGARQMDSITYELKDPIKFEDLDLTFFQELAEGSPTQTRFGANVILGVDANDDGKYEAKDLEYHVGDIPLDPSLLNGDTFVEMDALPPEQFQITAQDVPQWYTPGEGNAAPNPFATDAGCEYNQTLVDFVNNCAASVGDNGPRFDADDKIEVIRLVLGGTGSWNNSGFRLTTRSIGGEVKELKHVSFERAIPIP
ncbi:MAG: hypothetical protein ACRDO0_15675 [Nocardioidaceae bacterium]